MSGAAGGAVGKRRVEAYQYGEHSIWGATARILRQFLDLISSKGLPHPQP